MISEILDGEPLEKFDCDAEPIPDGAEITAVEGENHYAPKYANEAISIKLSKKSARSMKTLFRDIENKQHMREQLRKILDYFRRLPNDR